VAKIAIIDDEQNLRVLYRLELESIGHEVICIPDGRSAIPIVANERPDLVLLDINMPEGDGLEFLEWAIGDHTGIPVIINTSFANYKNHFLCWGAEAYVIKSSDLTELKNEIDRVLNSVSLLA